MYCIISFIYTRYSPNTNNIMPISLNTYYHIYPLNLHITLQQIVWFYWSKYHVQVRDCIFYSMLKSFDLLLVCNQFLQTNINILAQSAKNIVICKNNDPNNATTIWSDVCYVIYSICLVWIQTIAQLAKRLSCLLRYWQLSKAVTSHHLNNI